MMSLTSFFYVYKRYPELLYGEISIIIISINRSTFVNDVSIISEQSSYALHCQLMKIYIFCVFYLLF